MVSVTIDSSEFRRGLKDYAAAVKKETPEALKDAARSFVREAAAITPPAKGSLARARQTGERKIGYNFRNTFTVKRFKGKRQIKKVFGRPVKKPIFVATRENPAAHVVSDPEAKYREIGGYRGTRAKRRPAFVVSFVKVAALRRKVQGRIGLLASGWVAAAQSLGVNLPSWITRHGTSRGAVKLSLSGEKMNVSITHSVGFSEKTGLRKRVKWVLDKVGRGLTKRAEAITRAKLRGRI